MTLDTNTVIAFSIVGFLGTFLNSLYYGVRAYMNKTGPKINGSSKHMQNYSGHFEMDMLPMFVNLVTSLQYLGEILETYEHRFGFFNQYRYSSYLLTCPLMVYELCYTIGAPYRTSMTALTFFTIITALFADTSPTVTTRWTWFGIGCWLNIMFFTMLFKIKNHATTLNNLICSDKHIKRNLQRQFDLQEFPAGILQIRTPMDDKTKYIEYAFYLMFFLWPVFPIMFCIEYTGYIHRNDTQVVFAVTDLVIKSMHSYCLDMYKHGLCETLVPYGFLDTSILYDLELTNKNLDFYSQLKALSRSIYGDQIVGKRGELKELENVGLDYQHMLVAGRLNQKIDDWSETDIESMKVESSSSHNPEVRSLKKSPLNQHIEMQLAKEQSLVRSPSFTHSQTLTQSQTLTRSPSFVQSQNIAQTPSITPTSPLRSFGSNRRVSISKITPIMTPTEEETAEKKQEETPNKNTEQLVWH